jgi:hypothetical protein
MRYFKFARMSLMILCHKSFWQVKAQDAVGLRPGGKSHETHDSGDPSIRGAILGKIFKTTAKISGFSLLIYCLGCGSELTKQPTTQDSEAVPSITQVLPQTIAAGSQTATLKITGTNFPGHAVILWNGGAVATTVVDANTLSGTIGGSSLATPATVQLQVQNAQTMQESQAVLITIATTDSSSPLAISTTALPQALVGSAYTGTLVAAGGTSPYTWSIISGALPVGLSLAANTGIISGTLASSGNYSLGIKATDSSSPAQSVMATLALSVAAAPPVVTEPVAPIDPVTPLPTPPADATAYLNLQNQSGWKVCNGICAGSPETATGTSNLTPDIATPSMSGSAMAQNSEGTYWNTLYYLHLGCPSNGCAAVSNILEDMYFQTTSTSDMQGSEFDPDLFDGTYEYFASLQCRLVGTDAGNWFLWNMSANRWEMTNYPCTAATLAPGSWHHFQLYATFNTTAHTYTYETFIFDGVTVFQDLGTTYEASPLQGSKALNIEQQIDNGGETNPVPNNTNYYDRINLWAW